MFAWAAGLSSHCGKTKAPFRRIGKTPLTFVFFDGLILKHRNGNRYSLYLSWHDDGGIGTRPGSATPDRQPARPPFSPHDHLKPSTIKSCNNPQALLRWRCSRIARCHRRSLSHPQFSPRRKPSGSSCEI